MIPRLEFPDQAASADFMTNALSAEFDHQGLSEFERTRAVDMITSGQIGIAELLCTMIFAHLNANGFTRVQVETKIVSLPDSFLGRIAREVFASALAAGKTRPADMLTSLANKLIEYWNAEPQPSAP